VNQDFLNEDVPAPSGKERAEEAGAGGFEPSAIAAEPALWPAWEHTHRQIEEILQKDLFFIVGCQKSGTTWLKVLLNGHPEICCFGEACFWPVLLPALQNALAFYNEKQRAGEDAALTDSQLEYLFITTLGLVLGNALGKKTVKCIGEKTPEHALIAPPLAKVLPRAKFIHIVRDGRDGVTSGWMYNLHNLQGDEQDKFQKRCPDFNSYIEVYVNRFWLPYINSARSVSSSSPHRYFELRYEDLHSQPEPLVRRMLEFLQVDSSDTSLSSCLEAGSFERSLGGRQRGQTDQKAFYRKGIVGDWQNHFDEQSLQVFMSLAGDMMHQLGYE